MLNEAGGSRYPRQSRIKHLRLKRTTMKDEYLTIDELSSIIKFSKQSIYNLIHKKTLTLGKHYFKPTPKKLLFKWEAIQNWIERDISSPDKEDDTVNSNINI